MSMPALASNAYKAIEFTQLCVSFRIVCKDGLSSKQFSQAAGEKSWNGFIPIVTCLTRYRLSGLLEDYPTIVYLHNLDSFS